MVYLDFLQEKFAPVSVLLEFVAARKETIALEAHTALLRNLGMVNNVIHWIGWIASLKSLLYEYRNLD